MISGQKYCTSCKDIDDDTMSAETFAADSCRECGRKEGAYSDTVLIACQGCPELSCQHCLDEEHNGCAFCIKKRAEQQDTPYCNSHTQLGLGADNMNIMSAEHYTGGRPMTCPICISNMSQYQPPIADV